MSSDYEDKVYKATYELYEKGIPQKKAHTLVFRFLRLIGFKIRVPAYSEPRTMLIYCSFYFTVLIAGLYTYVQWTTNSVNLLWLVGVSVFGGVLAGLYMMWLVGYTQRKLELTPWDDL